MRLGAGRQLGFGGVTVLSGLGVIVFLVTRLWAPVAIFALFASVASFEWLRERRSRATRKLGYALLLGPPGAVVGVYVVLFVFGMSYLALLVVHECSGVLLDLLDWIRNWVWGLF